VRFAGSQKTSAQERIGGRQTGGGGEKSPKTPNQSNLNIADDGGDYRT